MAKKERVEAEQPVKEQPVKTVNYVHLRAAITKVTVLFQKFIDENRGEYKARRIFDAKKRLDQLAKDISTLK